MAAQNPVSPEILAKMVADMDNLRTSDPDSFTRLMQSMGLGGKPQGDASDESQKDSKTPELTPEQLEAWLKMMQFMKENGGMDSLDLPDGNSSMGSGGLEKKVRSVMITDCRPEFSLSCLENTSTQYLPSLSRLSLKIQQQ